MNIGTKQVQVDWRAWLPLAGGTLLLLLGVFCAWQTWLIADEGRAVARVHAAQEEAVKAVSDEIANQRRSVEQALSAVDPTRLISDPQQSAAALRQRLPQALKLELYSGDLNEVLRANYREFGYAKAAQLMAAQSAAGVPLAQSVAHGDGRRLSLVMPLGAPEDAQAWVWIELPFAPVKRRFQAISPAGGRLALRQGNDQSSLQLLSHGSGAGLVEAVGKPVAGSVFSISASLPNAFIVLPRSWLVSILFTLLGLGAGIYLLWLRWRSPPPVVVDDDESAISDEAEPVLLPVKPEVPPPPPPETLAAVVAPALNLDPSIFRAYDVRGVVGKTLSKEVAHALGQSIGALMVEKGLREIVIGRD
ncbi:MAG: phosphomannomutase/phosphoglucomutase, partial [Pseudomonadota bacterium]|nr:phosphomannomutase/phosphoglucomutase [Pseudomonadota bacterium]